MQLRLTVEELNLLSNLMMEHCDFASSHPDLLDKVLQRNLALDSDDLELLAGFLTRCKQRLQQSILHHGDASEFDDFDAKLNLVERVTEKVDEACAML